MSGSTAKTVSKKRGKPRIRTQKQLDAAEAKFMARIEKEREQSAARSADKILRRISSEKGESEITNPYRDYARKVLSEIKTMEDNIFKLKADAVKKIRERYKADPNKDKMPEDIRKFFE
jgi:hypothetical protein